jgi:hypothetical protein
MMILMGYSISKVLIGMLWVSLGLLVVVVLYRRILSHLQKGRAVPEDYCVLYSLEVDPVKGEIEFYFTTKTKRNIIFQLLNDDLSVLKILYDKETKEGGQIIRFDSSTIENGNYYFQIVTENQKTMKKFSVLN